MVKMDQWPDPRDLFELFRPFLKPSFLVVGGLMLATGVMLIAAAFLIVQVDRSSAFFLFGLGVLFTWLGRLLRRTAQDL